MLLTIFLAIVFCAAITLMYAECTIAEEVNDDINS